MCRMPKGISDYKILREENYVYIDKTNYVEKLENGSDRYIHFLRPRRFGKTLFTSMLSAYYDKNEKDNFEKLFGPCPPLAKGTYIFDHPTKERNSYYILRFDFSGLTTDEATALKEGFHNRIYNTCVDFLDIYHVKLDFPKGIDASDTMSYFIGKMKNKLDAPLFIIIDEYDHFANELLSFKFNDFHDAVSKNGYVRKFYEVLKTGTVDSTIGRIFITGVSPITLDSMTSGYNISTNLSLDPRYNEMMGFTSEEMKHLISMVDGIEDEAYTLKEMKRIYDGYMFSEEGAHHVFNPNMSLYYLDYMQSFGKPPVEIIDPNIYSDYAVCGQSPKKIENLLDIKPNQKHNKQDTNQQALMDIVSGEEIRIRLTKTYELSKKFSRDDFLSLLYYLGYLTIVGKEFDEIILKVPNQVIENVYVDYFKSMLEQDLSIDQKEYSDAMKDILLKKDNTKFVGLIEKIMTGFSSRDFVNMNESHVKLAAFIISSGFSYIDAKTEYPVGKRFIDLALFPHNVQGATALIELKYMKKKDYTEEILNKKKQEAREQLDAYKENKEFEGKDIVDWILIFCNEECVYNSQSEK